MTPELAARRTAAAALVAEFKRETDAFIAGTGDRPLWDDFAWRLYAELGLLHVLEDAVPADAAVAQARLHGELRSLLAVVEDAVPDPAAGKVAQIRAIFDTFDWQTDDPRFALEQIAEILAGGDDG